MGGVFIRTAGAYSHIPLYHGGYGDLSGAAQGASGPTFGKNFETPCRNQCRGRQAGLSGRRQRGRGRSPICAKNPSSEIDLRVLFLAAPTQDVPAGAPNLFPLGSLRPWTAGPWTLAVTASPAGIKGSWPQAAWNRWRMGQEKHFRTFRFC